MRAPSRLRPVVLLALVVSFAAWGCRSEPTPSRDLEALNEPFLDPTLELAPWVERFETESREVYREREPIAAVLPLRKGMRVADIGAGTGLFVPIFADAVGPEGRVYAIDIAPRFLDHLRQRSAEAGLTQLEVVAGREDSITLPQASVDVAFLCDTYHHFSKPEDSLASIHRALTADGTLVLVEFDRVPGESAEWLLDHVRADKATFQAEIEAGGFVLTSEPELAGLEDNYVQVFRKLTRP
jgi:SAM-dependent methyltransferase